MKALVFLTDPDDDVEPAPADAPRLVRHLATTPMSSRTCPTRRRWPTTGSCCDTRLSGICGVGLQAGPDGLRGRRRQPDDRVHLVPPGARPRGGRPPSSRSGPGGRRSRARAAGRAEPVAVVRAAGHRPPVSRRASGATTALCWNFPDGRLSPGIHTGNSSEATGGFAELLPAHRLMAVRRARRRPRRGRRAGRPVLGVAPRHHPQPAAAGGPGPRLRRRRARAPRRPRSSGPSTPTSTSAMVARWPAQADLARSARCHRVRRPSPRGADRGARRAGRAARCASPGRACRSPTPATSTSSTTPSARRQTVEVGMRVLSDAGHARADGRAVAGPLRVDALVLQGAAAGRLERVRRRGGRGRAQARHRALPRPGRRRAHRPRRRAHPPVPPRRVARRLHHDREPGHTGAIKVAFDYR